jgi:hypothetical protein
MTAQQARRSKLALPVLCQRSPLRLRRRHGRRQTPRTGYARPGSIFRAADRRPYCSRPARICWLKTRAGAEKRLLRVEPVCKLLCPLGSDVLDGSFRKRMRLEPGEPSESHYRRLKQYEAKARRMRKAEEKREKRHRRHHRHRKGTSYSTPTDSSSLFSTSNSSYDSTSSKSSSRHHGKHGEHRRRRRRRRHHHHHH